MDKVPLEGKSRVSSEGSLRHGCLKLKGSPLADHLLGIFTAKLGWKLSREMIHFLEVPWGGLWQESAQKPGLLPASLCRISTHGCSGSTGKIHLGPPQPSIPLQGRVMVLQPCSALLRERDAPRHQVLLPGSLCLFSHG